MVRLLKPSLEALPQFVDALQRGWSPDNIDGAKAAAAALAKIAVDPAAFVASLDDVEARGGAIVLPDGTEARRLPGYIRWIWDEGFCGSIGFRWEPGTSALPEHVFGHVGYAVPEWKRGRRYASEAVALILPEARAQGLDYIELTTDPDNIASQRVITNNGGVLVEAFEMPVAYGGLGLKLRYRIAL